MTYYLVEIKPAFDGLTHLKVDGREKAVVTANKIFRELRRRTTVRNKRGPITGFDPIRRIAA